MQAGSQHRHQVDILTDQAMQHLADIADEGIQVDHFGAQHLLTAEGKELPGQPGGSLCGLGNFSEEADRRIALGKSADQQLAVAGNDREQVIEIVSHAAGEPADRRELLRLGHELQAFLVEGLHFLQPGLGLLHLGEAAQDRHTADLHRPVGRHLDLDSAPEGEAVEDRHGSGSDRGAAQIDVAASQDGGRVASAEVL